MRHPTTLFLLGCLGALPTGCLGTHEPAADPLAQEAFEAEIVDRTCALLFECGCGQDAFADHADCVEASTPDVGPATRVAAGALDYDGLAARRCLDEMTCERTPEACGRVYLPLLEAGEPCLLPSECVDGACVLDEDLDAGRCERSPGLGEPCVDRCRGGSHCERIAGADEGTCVADVASGEPCTSHAECATGFCDGAVCASVPICRAGT